MEESSSKKIEPILKEAPADLTIILKGDKKYKTRRRVVNLRFNPKPHGIALCKTAEHVSFCIKACVKHKVKLRIRSGGHQHEGMSSADNVLLIDLSGMYAKEEIVYEQDNKKKYAWIAPGKKLKDVYKKLEEKGCIIPGGICDSVNVGGLSQGVGWGVSTRKLGYTSDNIEAVEMVKANGEIVIASNENKYKDLFWAIRGGGGGNFGVITRFKFKLSPLEAVMTSFVFTYALKDTEVVAHQWANFEVLLDSPQRPKNSEHLTIGGRISVEGKGNAKITLAGLYYGSLAEAQAILLPFLDNPKPIKEQYTIVNNPKPKGKSRSANKSIAETAEHSLATTLSYLGDVFNPTAPKIIKPTTIPARASRSISAKKKEEPSVKAPLDTCNGKHANKVSSAFPKDSAPETIQQLMDAVVKYIKASEKCPGLNNYVSLHGIGGNAQKEPAGGTPYPFRNRPFIFKIQAWWNIPDNEAKNAKYIQWVRDFKTAIAPYTDGAFINFQDKDLVNNPDAIEGRVELLTHYYKEHLPRLRAIKSKYDSENLFDFGMSIPLEG